MKRMTRVITVREKPLPASRFQPGPPPPPTRADDERTLREAGTAQPEKRKAGAPSRGDQR